MKNGILNILYTLRNIAFIGHRMYVPNLDIYSTIPYREICTYAAQAANVPYSTVDLVMKELYACFEYYICNGHSFKFSGLGTYALALKTKSDLAIDPAAREGADAITNSGIRFTPDKELLEMLSNLSLAVKAVGDAADEETEPIISKITVDGLTAMEFGKPTAKAIPVKTDNTSVIEIFGYNLNAMAGTGFAYVYDLVSKDTINGYSDDIVVNNDGTHARFIAGIQDPEPVGPAAYILERFRYQGEDGPLYIDFYPYKDTSDIYFWNGQWSILRGEKFVNIQPGQALPSGAQTVKFSGITNDSDFSLNWGNGLVTPRELSNAKGYYEAVYNVDNPVGEFNVSLGMVPENSMNFIGVGASEPMVSSASANLITALNGETTGVMPNRPYTIVLLGSNLSATMSVSLPVSWQFVSLTGTSNRLVLKVVTGTQGGDLYVGSNFMVEAAITDAPFQLSKLYAARTNDEGEIAAKFGPVGEGGVLTQIESSYKDFGHAFVDEEDAENNYLFIAEGSGIGNCTNVTISGKTTTGTPTVVLSKIDNNTLAVACVDSNIASNGQESGGYTLNFKANSSSTISSVKVEFEPYGEVPSGPGGGNGGGE